MTTNTATMDLFESRNHAVLSTTHRMFSLLRGHSRIFLKHAKILMRMLPLGHNLAALIDVLHDPFIEDLTQEQRGNMARRLGQTHRNYGELFALVDEADLGHWRIFYRVVLEPLNRYDSELVAHINALSADDSITLHFSKRDQEQLARLLTNQIAPNESLRKARERHTVS